MNVGGVKLRLAVVMQRVALANRWQPWQWRPLEVLAEDALGDAPGIPARLLREAPEDSRWLHGGFEVELFRDEAEGYFLNLDSPTPSWFIMWRMEGEGDAALAVPKVVTLSYNEAARMMDGGEQVDILPAPPEVVDMLGDFVARHYRPEAKGKRRRPSFEGGAAVQQMARAESDHRQDQPQDRAQDQRQDQDQGQDRVS